MANPKTLKPFGKGHDPRRNLKGRPKGNPAFSKSALEAALREKVIVNGKETTNEMVLLMMLIREAYKGKTSAFNLLFKYAYGRPGNYCTDCGVAISKRKVVSEKERLEEKKRLAEKKKEAKEFLEKWGLEITK